MSFDLTLALLGVIVVIGGALVLSHVFTLIRQTIRAWWQRASLAALIAPALPLSAWWIGLPVPWWMVALSLLLAAFIVWRRFGRASAVVSKWGETNRRKQGVASQVDIYRAAGGHRLRKMGPVLRPDHTQGMNRLALLREPLTEFGDRIARVGVLGIYHACEDFGIVFGGPRTGKTQWLINIILDAVGACLVTSTRTDLYMQTGPMREARGPVYVFNAGGVGNIESTITIDPLDGCRDTVTAVERATDLLAPSGSDDEGDRAFWNLQSRRILAALLHAAALDGERGMDDVARWIADPKAHQKEILWQLRTSPMKDAYSTELAQFIGTNDRTRTSITATIMPALAFLTSPSARAATQRGRTLDVERLLFERGTIYLIGSKDSASAPLVSALTGMIAREARRIAALNPSGRLDPNLTLVLDECAILGPPLEDWTADMGGRNVTIYAAFQSRAQLLSRWSEGQAAEILNNAATLMLFGGTNDKDDLQFWSTRAGDRDEPVEVRDNNGALKTRTVRSAPVLAPAQLAMLPKGKVVIFRRGMPPVVATAPMGYRRRDVRRHQGRLWSQLIAAAIAWVLDRCSATPAAEPFGVPDLHTVPNPRDGRDRADAA